MRRRAAHGLLGGLAALALLAGCGGGDGGGATTSEAGAGEPEATTDVRGSQGSAGLELTSPAFADGGEIPAEHTCEGAGTSPPLRLGGVPGDAASLALVVFDPDAPGDGFLHWTVYAIPPGARAFEPGAVPDGALQGENAGGEDGYAPPCPPEGDGAHRYEFTLSALSDLPDLAAGADGARVADAIAAAAIGGVKLTGTVER